ncbi:hypothetical protein CALCODRAFT_8959 [Calocera cornea HHB12733]|uniref:Uncharacterized protein n=1 Tax=Calocera cornea HHB12733 TaxID=1353952 RepID=A0A165J596_9BASI|nr:hypothetical protein CALCODRAFT_8959 [Calocera cornea HHB12733]
MPPRLAVKLAKAAKGVTKFMFSSRAVPTLKGALSYTIYLIISFIFRFNHINPFPASIPSSVCIHVLPGCGWTLLTGAVIITIASMPGATVGSCIKNSFLNMMGIMIGSLNYFILAKLADVPVAQGVVIGLMVYLSGLMYPKGFTYIGFALLGLLQSFTGIFITYADGGAFNPAQLLGFMQSYAFGCACAVAVNLLVLPRTAEHQLREALVTSLEHARTLLLLINKGYAEDLPEEERAEMELLEQAIRMDLKTLLDLLDDTGFEISWSRWSMADYSSLVEKIRSMHGMLLSAYYSYLNGKENHSIETFRDHFLATTAKDLEHIRRSLWLTFAEIMQ